MAQTYATGKEGTLSADLTVVATTLTATVDAGISAGRIKITESSTKIEWVSFTGKAANGSNFDYTGLTRNLSQTADPATGGTGLKFEAGTQIEFVAMHDQLVDKQEDTTFKNNLTVLKTTVPGFQMQSLTTTERDATSAVNGHIIYNETTGEFNVYQSGAWSAVASGSTQPNSSTTVAGKVETATTAESLAGTDTGGTGANNIVLPSDIAKNIQSGTFIYQGTETGAADAYLISLDPNLTAYTEGMKVTFKAANANTGASTINIDSLGVKSIKLRDGTNTVSGDIGASEVATITYDGTNFILEQEVPASTTRKGSVELATDAEAIARTDTTRYITPKTGNDIVNKEIYIGYADMLAGSSPATETSSGWQFSASATNSIGFNLKVIGGFTSISSIVAHTTGNASETNDLVLTFNLNRQRVSTAANSDSEQATYSYTAVSGQRSADLSANSAAYNSITLLDDDTLRLTFTRSGGDGSDTYTGVLTLLGITITLA